MKFDLNLNHDRYFHKDEIHLSIDYQCYALSKLLPAPLRRLLHVRFLTHHALIHRLNILHRNVFES